MSDKKPAGTMQVMKFRNSEDTVIHEGFGPHQRAVFHTVHGVLECVMNAQLELEVRAVTPIAVQPNVTNSVTVVVLP